MKQRSTLEGESLSDMRKLLDADDASAVRINDVAEGIDYVAATDSTGISVLIEIASRTSSHEHQFDIGLPAGARLFMSEDGSIDVLGDDRYSIGTFEAPWAIDANGNMIPTWYNIEGDTITQVVESNNSTVYPVIADPKFTWGWVTGTVYFNRQETGWLCASGRAALGWMAISGFWHPLLLTAVFIYSAYICLAVSLQKCVKVKSTGSVRHYSGGYCR